MRILLRSGKAPETVLGPEASLAWNRSGVFGANVGNFLFSHAVHELLSVPGTEIVPDSLSLEQRGVTAAHTAAINEQFDMLVLPLANAFRASFIPWLDRLTKVVSQLSIPVSVVGVGAQLPFSGEAEKTNPKLDASVRAFCDAVLERSPSIGVRGDITANYLRQLGIPDSAIRVIGCPSMFLNGPDHRVRSGSDELTSSSPIAFNVTPTVQGMGDFLQRGLSEFDDSKLVLQEFRELELLLWGTPVANYPSDLPGTIHHWMYQQDKLRFFLDTRTWFDFMRSRDFAVGNRIHGTMAALISGTPAVLLSHDSRTRELAEYHGVPFVPSGNGAETLDIRDLWEHHDPSEINRKQPENFENFAGFLSDHGLHHVYENGFENPDYREALNSIPFPKAVSPLNTENIEDVASRLQWLRQGVPGDQMRKQGSYHPPFLAQQQGTRSITDQLASAEREMKRMSQQLQELRAQLETHESHFSYMRRPIGERVHRSISIRMRKLRR